MKYNALKLYRVILLIIIIVLSSSACGVNKETPMVTKGPIFVVSKRIVYNQDGSSVEYRREYEYDKQGNLIHEIYYSGDSNVEGERTDYEYDQNGFLTHKSITTKTLGVLETTYTNTIESGHLVKQETDNGGMTEYTYHSNGVLSSEKTTYAKSDSVTTKDYNEAGFLIKIEDFGKTHSVIEYIWGFNDKGYPEEVTVHSNGMEFKIAFLCDSDGNIIREYMYYDLAGTNQLLYENEYVVIKNPSKGAFVKAQLTEF